MRTDSNHWTAGRIRGACLLRAIAGALLVPLALHTSIMVTDARAGGQPGEPSGSGLAIPRYVSLKSDRVNLRKGPGTEYPAIWEYRRAGLPVEVVREYEGWREVRDAESVSGWVSHSLLSKRRTALIEPWAVKPGVKPPEIVLRSSASETAPAVVKVEAGVIANIATCDGTWCTVTVETFKGYVRQKSLWGVYESEVIK